jgi:hypothetical protein
MRCEEDTIPKPDGLAGPVPGLEPNRSRTEAGRCPALFVLGSKLVFGLILDVPPGNVAEESRPVRMAGFISRKIKNSYLYRSEFQIVGSTIFHGL